jgi:hypothetical protein
LQPSGSWEVIHENSSWWHVTSACTNLVPFGGDDKTDGGGDGKTDGGGDDGIVVVVMAGQWW